MASVACFVAFSVCDRRFVSSQSAAATWQEKTPLGLQLGIYGCLKRSPVEGYKKTRDTLHCHLRHYESPNAILNHFRIPVTSFRTMDKKIGFSNAITGQNIRFSNVGICASRNSESGALDFEKAVLEEENQLILVDEMEETFTVEQAIDHVGFGRFQYLLLFYTGLAWMAEAMELMLLSFVGPAVQSLWGLSNQQESWISSVVFLGMLVGAYSWGILSDLKGRRAGFFTTAVLTFVASVFSALSPNYLSLLLSRALVGVGLGGAPVVFSLFLEFVPSKRRGFWLVFISLFWTLGSIAEAALAWAVLPTLGWRWLLAISSLPLALLLLLYPFVPESPRFYTVKNRTKDALSVLQQVAETNKKSLPKGRLVNSLRPLGDPSASETEVSQANKKESEDEGPFSVLSSLVSPPLLVSTALLWGVFFANAFTYYGLVLLTSKLTGGGSFCVDPAAQIDSDVIQIIGPTDRVYRDVLVTSFAEAPGIGLAALVVDSFGRKITMAGLLATTGLSLLPLLVPQSETATILSLFVARAAIMGSFQVLFVYAPEVYPTSIRSSGLGIANSFSRLGGILCPFVAVGLTQSCQTNLAILFFSGIPLAAAFAVTLFPNETKGKGLTDSVDDVEDGMETNS